LRWLCCSTCAYFAYAGFVGSTRIGSIHVDSTCDGFVHTNSICAGSSHVGSISAGFASVNFVHSAGTGSIGIGSTRVGSTRASFACSYCTGFACAIPTRTPMAPELWSQHKINLEVGGGR